MVLSGGPVARAHTVAAPVFAASSRLPASLSMVSVTASRRWMSSAPEDPTHGAAPVDQAAAEPYRPVGDFAGMEAIPVYDPEILKFLGISHVPPERIAEVLAAEGEGMTLQELYMMETQPELMEEMATELEPPVQDFEEWGPDGPRQKARTTPTDVWDPEFDVRQVNPRRRFFPGNRYKPEDLSPISMSEEWKETRNALRKKGCPLGGKKGPKVEFTNVFLLTRFVSQGGQILPRGQTFVCAKKQRELARAIKRARVMALIPYSAKLTKFY